MVVVCCTLRCGAELEKKKVAVIGAGPAGITAAYELSKKGIEVEVFEAAEEVGGLAKSIDLWDQRVDLGPHRFFSNDTKVNNVWVEVVGNDYKMVDRLTRIYYKNKFYYYSKCWVTPRIFGFSCFFAL